MSPKRVAAIRAEGVLDEFNYDIEFGLENSETGRIRVIYAPNGRGKTNFLRSIEYLLDPTLESLQALVDVPVRSLVVQFEGGGKIELSRQAAFDGAYALRLDQEDGTDAVDLSIDPTDFSGRLVRRVWDSRDDFSQYRAAVGALEVGATLIGDDRLTLYVDETGEKVRSDGRAAGRRAVGSVGRLLERVERMLSQAAFAALSSETPGVGFYAQVTSATLGETGPVAGALTAVKARKVLEGSIRNLLESGEIYERYGLLSLRQLRDIKSQLAVARRNNGRLPTLQRILAPYLESVQGQIESLRPALQLIDTFVTGVNKFLDRKRLDFSTIYGIRLLGPGDIELRADSLSSGERHLLYLMAHAVLATATRPLVVIDEPELSLGIEWQRNLLNELLRCTSSSGVQFLVASHSLQVMSAVPRDEIVTPSEA